MLFFIVNLLDQSEPVTQILKPFIPCFQTASMKVPVKGLYRRI